MARHLGVGPVEAGVVAIGVGDGGLEIIAVLFPARLCAPQPVDPSILNDIEAHNDQRSASHSRSFGSLCQTGFRGGPTEEVEGT